jgi:uncharacterized protein YceK
MAKRKTRGGNMTIRKVFLSAGTVIALSGCASMNSASVGSAAYVPSNTVAVAQNTVTTTGAQTSDVAAAATDQLTPGQPKPMRIYWFLGGR